MDLAHWLERSVAAIDEWATRFGPFTAHPVTDIDDKTFAAVFERFTRRLHDNYPFFHPRYAGQMVKPPHPAAVVGYVTAMLLNPNNHAREGGPATTDMEREVVAQLGGMFGLADPLGHLTTSGTMANLEALFVARESHPGKGIAFSADSHFTHARMCRVLGVESHTVRVDDAGRIDLDALEALLRRGRVGTVVLTAGTTGTGVVDPVHEALALKERYGVRLHVDAAYGGFFALLAGDPAAPGAPAPGRRATALVAPEPWAAVAHCDSVVVDPHKHGLQPYGCGAVLFADPQVARHYLHDSPYTYFTPSDLHLGEISLECSRAGAAAAALWLTFQLLPPTPGGLGRILAVTRRAAVRWARLIDESPHLRLHRAPDLDIVTYFPDEPTLSRVDAATERVLREGMSDPDDPVYLSTLRVDADRFASGHPDLLPDATHARVLRSVLMKPEADTHLDRLHSRIEALAVDKEASMTTADTPISLRSAADVAVRRATAGDRDELVPLLAAAFAADPVAVWIFPDAGRRQQALPEFFGALYDLYVDAGGAYTSAGRDGVILTKPPGVEAPPGFGERMVAIARQDAPRLMTVLDLLDAHAPPTPHHYIAFAGVAPDRQRSGTGAALMREVLRRCDQRDVPAYTEASSPGGHALARRYGFRPVGAEIRVPQGPALRPMWRDSHAGAP